MSNKRSIQRIRIRVLMVGIVSCCPISLSHANLVMDLVTVGNPGNLDDTHAVEELAMSDADLIEFRDALERLSELDARQARVVELRLLAGLAMDEIAGLLKVSKRTIEGDWQHAKAWLRAELSTDKPS